MGTAITLSLNGIDIDWGKNRYWKSHYWLFPPGSLTDVEYSYAGDMAETKPGFQTTLNEVHSACAISAIPSRRRRRSSTSP